MTLTLKTAKHVVGRYGRVINIVEEEDILDDYSVVREDALNPNSSEYSSLKPCIVVTTAREALQAAWELAHEPEDGVIPADAGYIRLRRSDGKFYLSHLGPAIDANDVLGKRRLLDPPEPEPEPEPEPWELSRYCYANGDIYKRFHNLGNPYWLRHGDGTRYCRKNLAKLNPRPVTIEGVDE